MWIWVDDCSSYREPKMCFCIGPEKCGDTSCELVQRYRARQKCLNKRVGKTVDEILKDIKELLDENE